MSREFGSMGMIRACSSRGFAFAALISLAFSPSLVRAQSDPVKTVAIKSEADEKPPIDEKHPLYKLLEVAYKSQKAIEPITAYECVFTKRELIGKKLNKSSMNLKFRESPLSVYLKFNEANAGREVIYVKGQNGNNLLVHEAGIKAYLGTFSIPATGTDALAENKYPITSIGLKGLLNDLIKQWETEGQYGGITTQKRPNSKLPTGEICTVYEAIHAKPFKEFRFHTTRLWIDDESGLAVGIQQLAFPGKNDKEPPLVEEYLYGKIKTNVKLTDIDFDKNNPNYAFK